MLDSLRTQQYLEGANRRAARGALDHPPHLRHHMRMKVITINVPEKLYRAFQESAAKSGQSASELIRNAMQQYYDTQLVSHVSIFDGACADVGKMLVPFSSDDDLLDEMLS